MSRVSRQAACHAQPGKEQEASHIQRLVPAEGGEFPLPRAVLSVEKRCAVRLGYFGFPQSAIAQATPPKRTGVRFADPGFPTGMPG